jgi:cellulose biosynthesis protein BcsQ
MKTRWLAIVGRKGGSGKTALALGLAAHYARKGARVLLVDMDPQGSASLALGADAGGERLAEILQAAPTPEMVPYVTFSGGLGLLAGGPALASLTAPRPLREALAGLLVDVVLVDCPPGHADLDRLALLAADVVLAATEAHRLGIAGAARVLDEARAMKPRPRCALVLSRVDDRRGLDRAAPDLLAGAFALPVLTIHQDAALALALNAGGLPPASGRAAADLEAVAAWIDRTGGKGTP